MPTFPGSLIPWVQQQFCDDNGDPIANGTVRFRVAGLVTLKDTYSNSDLAEEHLNANPVPLDANGRPTSGAIFLEPGGYDITVFDEEDVEVYSVEGVEDVGQTFLSEMGQTLGDGEGDAPDDYEITDDDNTVTLLPVAGGDYYLPAVADRGLPLTLINKGAVAATINRDGTDTFNGINTPFITIPAGTSPIFSGITLYPHSPSEWRVASYWVS